MRSQSCLPNFQQITNDSRSWDTRYAIGGLLPPNLVSIILQAELERNFSLLSSVVSKKNNTVGPTPKAVLIRDGGIGHLPRCHCRDVSNFKLSNSVVRSLTSSST